MNRTYIQTISKYDYINVLLNQFNEKFSSMVIR